jgi:hypothetical protein
MAKIDRKPTPLPPKPLPKPVEAVTPEKGAAELKEAAIQIGRDKLEGLGGKLVEGAKKLTGTLELPKKLGTGGFGDMPGGCFPDPFPHGGDRLDALRDNLEFSSKDKDDNQNLNRDEFDAGQGFAGRIGADERFDRYDSDNDGYVNREEFHAGKEADRNRAVIIPGIIPSVGIDKPVSLNPLARPVEAIAKAIDDVL